jgi:hypothetical protein
MSICRCSTTSIKTLRFTQEPGNLRGIELYLYKRLAY